MLKRLACHVERSGDSHEVETSIKMHLYNDNHIDSSTALRSAQNDIINWTVAKHLACGQAFGLWLVIYPLFRLHPRRSHKATHICNLGKYTYCRVYKPAILLLVGEFLDAENIHIF